MTLLVLLFIAFVIIGFTSKYRPLAIAGKALAVGTVAWVISSIVLLSACDTKSLPYSFCGEITGFINIFVTSILIAMAVAMVTTYLLARKK